MFQTGEASLKDALIFSGRVGSGGVLVNSFAAVAMSFLIHP